MTDTLPSGKTLIFILIVASIASFMSALDGTIVNIALPSIAKAFDLSTSSVAWVSTIYLLVIAGLLLIIGKITDTLGLKKYSWEDLPSSSSALFPAGFSPTVCTSLISS